MSATEQIRLVVFDWAGTTVDYGSSAPSDAFVRIFEDEGIRLTRAEINTPMGMEKRAHIRTLLTSPSGARQWLAIHGKPAQDADIGRLYRAFEAVLEALLEARSVLLDGVVETVAALRAAGIAIGSTTGYSAKMMQYVAPCAAELGYQPDCIVTPEVTGSGRPGPFMLLECMRRLDIYPPRAVVKVGDTAVDMREGVNAGAWSVGVLEGSSMLGLSAKEYAALTAEELQRLREDATARYRSAGADLVIGSIRELPQAIAALNRRLAEEQR
ncbi:MAG: phosphonoacetaldehyde hydrolase [Chloroflexi bacterium]|nr:phosphonoacetaldehyde hydrolase [Chloroflexota bacterium]